MINPPIYPGAVLKELTGHSAPGTLIDKNQIILHCTEGSTMEGAYETFASSVAPHRVSAHFIIDRDGTVYQLLNLSDVAWHASQVNHHSIGIEHVAMNQETATRLARFPDFVPFGGPDIEPLLATDAQYTASAGLVKWLCELLGIPCDRNHIRTHNEASPADGHVLCCTGALDPDKLVGLANAT
jgi:N-acetyl-anhydromuramyl-L-alanine amidase AmpD